MGSAKNKSSFRIADILHQQQNENSNFWRNSNSQQSNKTEFNLNNSADKPVGKLNEDVENKKTPPTTPTHDAAANENISLPFKPTPIPYSNFLDLQKANFPFPLGLSAFHPAAYLNYADALHKGKRSFYCSEFLIVWNY